MTPSDKAREIVDKWDASIDTAFSFDERMMLDAAITAALEAARSEALDQVLKGIDREQNYREYREDQDGSAVGACKEIRSYVRALKSQGGGD